MVANAINAGLTFIALLTTTETALYCKTTTTIKAIFFTIL